MSWTSAGVIGQAWFVPGFIAYVVFTWGLMSWRSRLYLYSLALIIVGAAPDWIDLAVGRTDPNSWRGINGIALFAVALHLGLLWLWPYRRQLTKSKEIAE